MLLPNQVFTPGRPPVSQTNVYVARGEAQQKLSKGLDRSLIPIIFGEYGVGKTSLARHSISEAEQRGRLVNVESVDGKTFSQVVQQLLEHVGYTVKRSVKKTSGSEIGTTFSGEAGVSFEGFEVKLGAERAKSTATTDELHEDFAVTAPSDARVLDVAERRQLVLILDELHKATPDFVRNLSSFMKSYHNKPCVRFKVILVGTSSDASRLVQKDPGIDRIIQEVPLLGMTALEARTLINEGMARLAIDAPELVVDSIARTASGSPTIIQYLGLEVAELAFGRSPRLATVNDCGRAIKEYVESRAARLNDQYLKAIETTGARRYRKRILHAMANVDDDYVTMEQLARRVSDELGEEIPSTALSGPLKALKSPEFGEVLKDVERREAGERVYNYSTFTDPTMKAFIRMRYTAVAEGLVLEP